MQVADKPLACESRQGSSCMYMAIWVLSQELVGRQTPPQPYQGCLLAVPLPFSMHNERDVPAGLGPAPAS